MKFSLRRQSTGKAYPYAALLSPAMFYGFFRKVYLHNLSGVPSDKPVLLAANHPTAFMDPCLLCTYIDPPIYNMTRGDVFEKPFFRMLMESVNMFPVYRVRDGYNGRDRNDEVFDYCVDKLYHRRVVTVYVEGEHHLEKRVRPVQKGIARIAFAAYERHKLDDLQIIPAGCNYRHGDRPRDEVAVNIGEPLWVKNYWALYQQEPAAAIQQLCLDIEKSLKSVCYHIENVADDELAEQLLTLWRSDHPEPPLPVVTRSQRRFAAEKAVLDRLNALTKPEKSALREKVLRYFSALEKANLDDAALVNPRQGAGWWLLFFLAGLLPFLAGRLSSWPLVWLARYATASTVRKREFLSSVHVGTGFLAGVPYYLLLLLTTLLSGRPFWVAIGLALPVLGWFSMFYKEMWLRWRAARKAAGHSQKDVLQKLRSEIPTMMRIPG